MNPTSTDVRDDLHDYPRGSSDPAYRFTFQVWIVGFLLTICISLTAFLATWAKSLWR